jgi:hypothetical protein
MVRCPPCSQSDEHVTPIEGGLHGTGTLGDAHSVDDGRERVDYLSRGLAMHDRSRRGIPMRSGGLYIEGSAAPAQTAALVGWRMTWEGRLSCETLTPPAGRRFLPFGLFEWLAFAPDRGNDPRKTEWRIAMLDRFAGESRKAKLICSRAASSSRLGRPERSPSIRPLSESNRPASAPPLGSSCPGQPVTRKGA